MRIQKITLGSLLLATLAAVTVSELTGCDRKEKVIDIETPGGDIEVERSTDTGKIDVDVND